MAGALEIPPSLADVISQLDLNAIPDRLRCPSCERFLLNGFKVACCDQVICESCFERGLPHCPVCEHKPFSKELGAPNKAMRGTAKAFLKLQEKRLENERTQGQRNADKATLTPPAENDAIASIASEGVSEEDKQQFKGAATEAQGKVETQTSLEPTGDDVRAVKDNEPSLPLRSGTIEDRKLQEPLQAETTTSKHDEHAQSQRLDDKEDEPLQEDDRFRTSENYKLQDTGMEGFPDHNMDMNQMMQFANANGMPGFNPMMGFPNMMMNPMSQGMFGGFGGPGMNINGMNGMNMGMNFNPGSSMYGSSWNGPNNNMWNGFQSNNPNAFLNGFGGDFGSTSGYGYNMPPGNFHGEYSYAGRGYGRGRGRGRGGYGRGRGNYHQYQPGNQYAFQAASEQHNREVQAIQTQLTNEQNKSTLSKDEEAETVDKEPDPGDHTDDEFAPGGQDEVQEALGEAYHQSQTPVTQASEKPEESIPVSKPAEEAKPSIVDVDSEAIEPAVATPQPAQPDPVDAPADSPRPETPAEAKASMPPPSAPLGPAAHHRELEDLSFRGRGSGRFGYRGRGSFSGRIPSPISPNRADPQPNAVLPPEPKGVGVVGAPTGPRAMREPPARLSRPSSSSFSNGGGFRIVGRASMTSQNNQSRPHDRSRSTTPVNGHSRHRSRSRSPSRHESHHSRHGSPRREHDQPEYYERDDHDRRRSRTSKKEEHDDYEMQDTDKYRSRSGTPDEGKSSRRSHRDKDRSSKHHSSRSHRNHNDVNGDDYHEVNDHERTSESRSTHHRSSRSRRHEDRDRDREADYEERQRDRDRDRKRSRHDYEHTTEDDVESRHRSRRHKRDHHRDRERERDIDTNSSTPITGLSRSHRSSGNATPAPQPPELPQEHRQPSTTASQELGKDPQTLEREARNRERMLKEQQRREKAMQSGLEAGPGSGGGSSSTSSRRKGPGAGGGNKMMTGGRRVSYRYEDDLRSAMVENERESNRWR